MQHQPTSGANPLNNFPLITRGNAVSYTVHGAPWPMPLKHASLLLAPQITAAIYDIGFAQT
jgi:hypothetical protein